MRLGTKAVHMVTGKGKKLPKNHIAGKRETGEVIEMNRRGVGGSN